MPGGLIGVDSFSSFLAFRITGIIARELLSGRPAPVLWAADQAEFSAPIGVLYAVLVLFAIIRFAPLSQLEYGLIVGLSFLLAFAWSKSRSASAVRPRSRPSRSLVQ